MTDEWTAPEFGLKAALGFTLENRDGQSIAVLKISGVHLNPNGVVHGAVPFTMMDTAMGGAVMNTIKAEPNTTGAVWGLGGVGLAAVMGKKVTY